MPPVPSSTKRRIEPEPLPALLVSYVALQLFDKYRDTYVFRDWVMDSGAFSAFNSGKVIQLQAYIDVCKQRIATDPQLTEVFALDVIGDWKASAKNTEQMWAAGVPAIPCFHMNEPWHALTSMARDYPKIALGGIAQAGFATAMKWANQCFARVWPKRIHGFAFGAPSVLWKLPFHSTDCTNWELRPRKYGIYDSFGASAFSRGGARISVKGGSRNLRPEIEMYLANEAEARRKWAKQMAELGADRAPTIRLASADGLCFAKSGYVPT